MEYSDRIWDAEDCARILAELSPRIGNHAWAVALSRFAEPREGGFQKWIESLLKRAFNRSKPLFKFQDDGLTFVGDRRDRYSRWISGSPGHEAALANRILAEIRGEGAYIDVGANMGVLAGFIARSHGGPVVAVEPDRDTAQRAAAGFALNGQSHVKVVNAAAGEEVGEGTFFVPQGRSDASSLHGDIVDPEAIPVKVPLVSIDDLVRTLNLDRVAFVKVDVEGHEPAVIRGALDTIRRCRPAILFEYHWDIAPKLGWQADEVCCLIESAGEYHFEVLGHGDQMYPFPPSREMGLVVNVLAMSAQ